MLSSWHIELIAQNVFMEEDVVLCDGGPNLVICGNNEHTEGIFIYLFPNAETDAQSRKNWGNSARKHGPDFSATIA